MKTGLEKPVRVFTIGHSSHSFEQFLSLLTEFHIYVVADIRRYPGSGKWPQFNSETLNTLLEAENIRYIWFEALGGWRRGVKQTDSPNTGLKSPGFRNYADYMATEEFRAAVQKLLSVAETEPTAIMCAEKLYWRCHRRLLSDYLTAKKGEVLHILQTGRLQPHQLTKGATTTADGTVIYPATQSELFES
jgi:uncharacterized protein (DUF488 family)